jgi:hypothetical protein
MALPQFPLNVLGSVLARNRSEMLRAVRPEEQLMFKCEVGKVCKMNAKGDSEIELTGSATDKGEHAGVLMMPSLYLQSLNKGVEEGLS